VKHAARLSAIVIALALALAAPVLAGDLTLTIRDGRVTLNARDVTVSQILAEWERVGHTKIIDGQRVPGSLVTLQLDGVTERQALDVLLRSVAGYIAAPRPQPMADASSFDRIIVMPAIRVVSLSSVSPMGDDANRFRQGMGARPGDEQDQLQMQQMQMYGPGGINAQGNPQMQMNYNPNYPGGNPAIVNQMPYLQPGQPNAQPAVQAPANPSVPVIPQGTAVPGQVVPPVKPKGPGGPGGR
jgi:hypothetical protein